MTNKTKDALEALDRLRSDAVYGINSGDHEIMNPDNYQKEMQQHFDDVELIKQALEKAKKYEAIEPLLADKHEELQRQNEIMREALELVVNDVDWWPNSPTLKFINKALEETK